MPKSKHGTNVCGQVDGAAWGSLCQTETPQLPWREQAAALSGALARMLERQLSMAFKQWHGAAANAKTIADSHGPAVEQVEARVCMCVLSAHGYLATNLDLRIHILSENLADLAGPHRLMLRQPQTSSVA